MSISIKKAFIRIELVELSTSSIVIVFKASIKSFSRGKHTMENVLENQDVDEVSSFHNGVTLDLILFIPAPIPTDFFLFIKRRNAESDFLIDIDTRLTGDIEMGSMKMETTKRIYLSPL